MFNNTHLPQSHTGDARDDSAAEGPHEAGVASAGFSRLALCLTAVSALTLGVVGTVAYGVWFNHDQQAYAEAIASARQSLGMPAGRGSLQVQQAVSESRVVPEPGSSGSGDATLTSTESELGVQLEEGSKHTVWSGQIATVPTAPAQASLSGTELVTPFVASATSAVPVSPAPSLRSGPRATNATASRAQQSATRTARDPRPGQQDQRTAAADARRNAHSNEHHQDSLFARMGLFFRRVSYRQRGGASPQQDLYSHP